MRGSACVRARAFMRRARVRACARTCMRDRERVSEREGYTQRARKSVRACVCKRAYVNRACMYRRRHSKDIYHCIHTFMQTCAICTHHLIHEPPRHIVAPNRLLGHGVYGHALVHRAVMRVSEGVSPVIEARVTYLCVCVRERESQRACIHRTCVYRRRHISMHSCKHLPLHTYVPPCRGCSTHRTSHNRACSTVRLAFWLPASR